MYTILRVRNEHILRELNGLQRDVAAAGIPEELTPYARQLSALCSRLRMQIERNLQDLTLGQRAILEDVRSNTEQVVGYFDLLSGLLATPILRSSSSDRLSLKVVTWLHQAHSTTKRYPAAIASGDCAIQPLVEFCPIYFFPAAEQAGLLYQPLYFHEFGHLLYRCHRDELDELVLDLRRDIFRMLTPASYRSDRYSARQDSQRQAVTRTWYHWAQELFCDTVGLTICGPSFLRAFSSYLAKLRPGDFYLPRDAMASSRHPPTWLRIKLLHIQASSLGMSCQSGAIVKEWDDMASLMGIVEDYHGFYDDAFESSVLNMLRDAVTEAAPRAYLPSEVSDSTAYPGPEATPVTAVHRAWCAFLDEGTDYSAWETVAAERWLG